MLSSFLRAAPLLPRAAAVAAALVAAALCVSCPAGPEPRPAGPGPGPGPESGAQPPAADPGRSSPAKDPPPGPGTEAGEGVGRVFAARSLELGGDLEGAIAAYREALASDPGSEQLTRSLARVLAKAGKGPEAADLLRRFLSASDAHEARLQLVDVLDRLGDTNGANAEIGTLLGKAPLPRDLAETLSRRFLRRGDVEGAARALRAMGGPGTQADLGDLLAGQLLLDQGFVEEARECFESAVSKDPLSSGLLGLASVLGRLRNWKAAADRVLEFVEKCGNDAAGALPLGEYLEKAGDLEGAARWLEKAVAARIDLDSAAPALARVYRRLGKRDEALAAYREAVKRSPGNIPLAYGLATLLDETGAEAEAERLLASAAKRGGRLPYVSHYLAWIWARRGDRLEEAEAAAREAVESDPDVGAYQAVLGYVQGRRGSMEQARASFEKALASDPDPFVHRLHGDFLSLAGEAEKAREAWKRAVALDPRLDALVGAKIRGEGK